jgi:hypothetical protein
MTNHRVISFETQKISLAILKILCPCALLYYDIITGSANSNLLVVLQMQVVLFCKSLLQRELHKNDYVRLWLCKLKGIVSRDWGGLLVVLLDR